MGDEDPRHKELHRLWMKSIRTRYGTPNQREIWTKYNALWDSMNKDGVKPHSGRFLDPDEDLKRHLETAKRERERYSHR